MPDQVLTDSFTSCVLLPAKRRYIIPARYTSFRPPRPNDIPATLAPQERRRRNCAIRDTQRRCALNTPAFPRGGLGGAGRIRVTDPDKLAGKDFIVAISRNVAIFCRSDRRLTRIGIVISVASLMIADIFRLSVVICPAGRKLVYFHWIEKGCVQSPCRFLLISPCASSRAQFLMTVTAPKEHSVFEVRSACSSFFDVPLLPRGS